MIEFEEYLVPPAILDPATNAFDKYNDPHSGLRATYNEPLTMREKATYEMKFNRTPLDSVIWGRLSSESEVIIKHADYWDEIETSKDSLQLYLRILETHRTPNTDFGLPYRRTAREEYSSLKQMENYFNVLWDNQSITSLINELS